ncbi:MULTISPECIES: ABC transporter permease subunit [Thermomonospora]|uniref:Binding-protein-dependent transport systems inner membrane component n=1 Tax=Thermomonospora curvata (strain ATCC 19995 / DSM 43183 / JCM 3096 / KCTC 9072 / NBRC 15933 / NCIMB 10081 / Henssen B9) TaxID=471852 RepID=D1AA31_THECD|nr:MULTISPECIES: ABC transporter permease subunit [Thermomonospora]ACY96967.1 binding-protein-dependent transport systems inner membrane component [Thermomonospora curvata DSM 43183]PKK15243.1 MAG: ABC transporter permease [Thermomonospora sp. CIF 1]
MTSPATSAASAPARPAPAITTDTAPPRRFRFPYRTVSWATPFALILLWEAAARAGLLSAQVLPAPSSVVATAVHLTASGELPQHLLASLRRAALGFVIGAAIGLTLGVAVGLSRIAEAFIDRSVQMIRAIPFLAILPLVIVWFGVGEAGKIFLIAKGSAFPLYLNTVLGIRQIDTKLLEMGQTVGLSRAARIRTLILPGALPSILGGLRMSLTYAWLALVIAETVGAMAGIGFLATNAREFLQVDVIVLVVVLYAGIGIACDLLARLLERRLLSWHPSYARLTV